MTRSPTPASNRAWLWSGAILVLTAMVTTVVVIVLVRASNTTSGGGGRTADGVVDSFAAALVAHDSSRVSSLSCSDTRAAVENDAHAAVSTTVAATRSGEAAVHGDGADAAISVTVHQTYQLPAPSGQVTTQSATPTIKATLRLKRVAGAWCVEEVSASLPSY